jgi:hypothetical protein
MDKRISQRTSGKLMAAAVASVGLAGFGAATADASLLVDVRAAGVNNVPIVGDRKNVLVNQGDTVTFNVVVRVSGTNATQNTGNFDGQTTAVDTRNDDTIQALVGAFQSVGSLKASFQGGAASNQGGGNLLATWAAGGSNNGAAVDFDSDGDLDLGVLGTDPTNMWVARAAAQMIPTVAKKTSSTRFGVTVAGATGAAAQFNAGEDFGGPNTAVPDTQIIDATTAETLLGELTIVVTGDSGTTAVNFVPRSNGDSSTALWFEDGITTGKSPANSPFGVGAPVNLIVPEPSTLGLMGLASLGLLARRRKQD